MDDSIRGNLHRRIGSLPPDVVGKINGYLSLTVEDMKWRIEPQDVHIYVSWWGEKRQVQFISQGAQFCGSLEATYIYRIMTNTELFVSYLQDCEELTFELYEPDTRFYIGSATLNNLVSIILYNPFKTSCVVADKDGSEIADLTISFVFRNCASMPRELETSEIGIYNVIEKIQNMDMEDHRKTCILKKVSINTIPTSNIQQIKPELLNIQSKGSVLSLNKNDETVSNSTISELLEQSQSIREEYYNYKKEDLLPKGKKTEEDNVNTEPMIQDYLSGKDLSKEEMRVALDAVKFQPELELLQLSKDCNSKFEGCVQTNQFGCSSNEQGEQNFQYQIYSFEKLTKSREKIGKHIKDSQNVEKRNGETLKVKSSSLYSSEEKKSTVICFKYLRLTIETLSLNYVGMQRVIVSSQALASSTREHISTRRQQLPPNIVYFVEYEIPRCLRVCSNESDYARKPWNSNLTRICARQKASKCIHFYRQMIHRLASYKPRFKELLCSASITFKVYSRHLNQRLPCLIGEASLSLGKAVESYAFNSLHELSMFPQSQSNSSHMLSLGILKLKVEFGSSQTCLEIKQLPSIVAQSLASSSESECENGDIDTQSSRMFSKGSLSIGKPVDGKLSPRKNICCADRSNNNTKKVNKGNIRSEYKIFKNPEKPKKNILLFGLLYVSIGREIKASGTYLVSHGFWKEDVMTSDIHWNTENPPFKFHKIMPVLLSVELLDRCYNNFMVVEVWAQSSLIGISKLPLNQFYIAYRDPPVVEQLLSSKYPIISVDGWIDVLDPVTQFRVGQLNVLLALGTEKQIQMLEMSRCLKADMLNTSRSTSPLNVTENPENDQILKLQCGRSTQNVIDLHYNDELCGDSSTQLMESNNAISKDDLFVSCDSSDDSFQKSAGKNNCKEIDVSDVMLLHPSQNIDTLEVEDIPVHFSDTLNKTGHTQEECEGISMIQEHFFFGNVRQCDSNPFTSPILNDLKGNSNYAHKHTILESSTKYLDTLDPIRNLKISSQKSLDENLLQVSRNMINNFDQRNTMLFHKENHNPSKTDNNSFGSLVGNEKVILATQSSNLLHDNNNAEHSTIDIADIISESRLKSCDILNSFPCEVRVVQERFPQHSDLTLEDLDYDKEIIVDSEGRETKNQNDYQSKKFSDNSSSVALTENMSTQTDVLCAKQFLAMIEIINGLYISKLDNGELPNCYITFHVANNLLMSTSVINQNTDPIWNWSCEVWLPVSLLENNEKCLIFKVWHKNNSSQYPNPCEDIVIGFVAIDMRVLVCGLPAIIGWFNINDMSGVCKGQIQVSITPLGNTSQVRNSRNSKLKIDEKRNEKYLKSKMLSTPLPSTNVEVFEEIISHNKIDLEENNVFNYISQGGKESVNLTTQNQESYQIQNDNERSVSNKISHENYDASHGSSSKIDFLPPKINETKFNCENQMYVENYFQNINSDMQINDILFDLDPLLMNQNNFKKFHHVNDSKDTSFLTQTLQLKFQELDEIIELMKNRLRRKSADLETKVTDNSLSSEQQCRVNYCSDIVDHANKCESVNFSQKLSKENIEKSSEDRVFSSSAFLHTKEVTPRETGESLHSDENIKLPQTSEYANYSPSHIKPDSKINQGRYNASETKNTLSNSDFVKNCSYSDLMTDHLMSVALREMDIENIFNPLLFQHIIASHQSRNCCSQWYDIIRRSPFSFHKVNCAASEPSEKNKGHLWKSCNYPNILSQMSSTKDLKECDTVNEFVVNNKNHLATRDSPPIFSDGIIVSSRSSQHCVETLNTEQNSPCFSLYSKHLKKQNSIITQNSSERRKISSEKNSKENETLIPSNGTFLTDRGSSHYTSSIQLPFEVKRQAPDQIIFKTNSNDKNKSMKSLGNCSCELENKESVIEHSEKMSATSFNMLVVTDSLEKEMPEEINSALKLSDEGLYCENHAGLDKELIFIPSNVDVDGYPIELDDSEIKDLMRILKKEKKH